MLDPRIYRAAFIPVLFALVLVAFSLENRPRSLGTPLAPDAFQGDRAFGSDGLTGLAGAFPDRRPGSAGDVGLAGHLAGRMRAAGFRVRTATRQGQTIDGKRDLRTVIAERAGTQDERIVVVAHRDAAGRRAEAELSGTAALLELARVFGAPLQTRRTLTLVSTSGGSGGGAGAAALREQLGRGPVAGVLVLGSLASTRLRPPLVTPWSNALGATPLRLQRTVQQAVRIETASGAGAPRAISQFARFALPATTGEQGALLADGLPAVLLSAIGERVPDADAPVSRDRLESFGRAALRTVTALDSAPGAALAAQPISRDLLTSRKVLPGWAVRLFAGALLLPVLVAGVDAFARVRRRREPVGAWLRWTLAGAVPFLVAVLFAAFMGVTGLLSAVPDAPVSPEALPVQVPALLAVGLVFVLAWVLLRPAVLRLTGAQGDPASAGAGVTVVLVALAATVVVWIGNPYAAVLLAPALHVWLFATAPEFRLRPAAGVAAVALGLVPLAVALAVLASGLDLGPAGLAWMGLLLVAGGHVSALGVLLWSLLAACAIGALLVAARGPAHAGDADAPITVRGPRTYAGPGSLGGTESALRR
jgi:ribosomal protein L34